jgi:hypothetical protein
VHDASRVEEETLQGTYILFSICRPGRSPEGQLHNGSQSFLFLNTASARLAFIFQVTSPAGGEYLAGVEGVDDPALTHFIFLPSLTNSEPAISSRPLELKRYLSTERRPPCSGCRHLTMISALLVPGTHLHNHKAAPQRRAESSSGGWHLNPRDRHESQ